MKSFEFVTRLLSKSSPVLVDLAVKKLAHNNEIRSAFCKIQSRRLSKISSPKRVLVIPDINIGDAVISQSFIANLKRAFPNLEISFIYQRKALPLIKANPYVDKHFPYFRNIGFPSNKDMDMLRKVVSKYNFDAIFNFCPYFPSRIFRMSNSIVLYPTKLVLDIIRAYETDNQIAHYALHMKTFSIDVIKSMSDYDIVLSDNPRKLSFPHIFTYPTLLRKTKIVMKNLNVPFNSLKILFNPDASSRFTLIPQKFQVEMLKGILSIDKLDYVLMNCGFTFDGIEKTILKELPTSLRKKIVVIPKNTGIGVYASLIDHSDMFISGDTGPMHIAAAKKFMINSENSFKNSTAIVSIFGATSAKIYGYDSFSSGYLSSAQDAPSKVFEGCPSCKNLTCINKIFKDCREVRCFQGLKPEQIVDYVHKTLENIH